MIAFLFLSLLPVQVGAQSAERRVEASLRFLADDLLEGRGTPGRGLDIAALYLLNELRAAGWEPGNGDSYLQTFEVGFFNPKDARYKIRLGNTELRDGEYILLPFGINPAETPIKSKIVFAGHGIFAPERGVDDYGSVDLKNKAVVTLFGAPWEPDMNAPHSYDRVIGKAVRPTVGGATCLVYVTHELDLEENTTDTSFIREMNLVDYTYLASGAGGPTMGMGIVLNISPSVFDRCLKDATGKTYEEWQQNLKEGTFQAREIPAELELTIDVEPEQGTTSNVVGILPGEDPALEDEWVILTAHYDHLGFKEVPPGEDGIWNGADDNASGTAALLEIARRLALTRGNGRSLMIMFTSGEDRGMIGSGYYATDPIVPLESVVLNLNVDMVGRSKGSLTGFTTGTPELLKEAQEVGKANNVNIVPDSNPTWRVAYFLDSYHFARFGIPYVEFFAEMHEDYHQPSDEIDKINLEGLMQSVEVVIDLANSYAQGAPRPSFERPEWFITPDF